VPTKSRYQDEGATFGRFSDLEVTGRLIGPQFRRMLAAIDALVARNETVTLGNSVIRGLDPVPAGGELFDLSQPDCVSSLGRKPTTKEIVYSPAYIKDELGTELANNWSKWSGLGVIGCFPAVTNLVVDPEDLSTSSWSESNVDAPTDSGYTLQGRKLWLIQNSSAAAGYEYQEITVTTDVHAIQAVVKKGTTNAPTLRAYDGATLRCQVDCDFSGATPTATASTGTLAFAKAIGTDAILVGAITTAFTGTTMSLRVYTGSADDNANVYATALQVQLKPYPTPYAPTSRSVGSCRYPLSPALSGTIDVWVRPLFTYDATGDKYVWRLGGGAATNQISLLYEAASDKWEAWAAVDGSNYRVVRSTNAFTDNSLWAWQHIRVVWDCANDGLSLFVDGVEQTATGSAGTIASMSFASNYLYVGGLVTGYACACYLADLCYQASTEDETTTHYSGGVRYYDPTEVTNKYRSVRINRYGIRLHDGALGLTDDWNRSIEVSPSTGLLAKDAAGAVIHDISNSPIMSGMAYGGHVHWKNASTYISSVEVGYTDTSTWKVASSSLTNVSLASVLPSTLTNVRGALVLCGISLSAAAGKVDLGSEFSAHAVYSTSYNTAPTAANYLCLVRCDAVVAGVAVGHAVYAQALVPVFWVSGVPYITWQVVMNFGAIGSHPMAANNALYGAGGVLFFLGPLV